MTTITSMIRIAWRRMRFDECMGGKSESRDDDSAETALRGWVEDMIDRQLWHSGTMAVVPDDTLGSTARRPLEEERSVL